MYSHIMVGANDIAASKKFYDAILGAIGHPEGVTDERGRVFWITESGIFSITTPIDGNPATAGNGTMVALTVDSPEKVDEVHAKAMELGGQDEGAPGRRSEGFYAGYFRDLDGNKLNVFCAGPAAG
jgi:predicted lactoylglutathione lyase